MNKVICFGETLWDILPTKKVVGGAPLNVAIHLCNIGIDTLIISRIGNDALGRELTSFIKNKGMNLTFLEVDDLNPTGVVNVDISDANNANYDIVLPSAWDFISFKEPMLKAVKNANIFVFGSLAARTEVSRNTLLNLLKVAKYRVFDVNLRSPHFDKNTLDVLMNHADMVKLNDDEIKYIIGLHSKNHSLKEQMTFLKSKYGLDRLCVTRGVNGAVIMDNKGFYEHPGYSVEVVDAIGCGDSFLATLLRNLIENISPQIALQKACAMGAMVATYDGATPVILENDIEEFLNQTK